MRVLKLSFRFALCIMLFLSIACTSTKFTTIWKDEAYQGHPEKVLVINAFPNPANRRIVEDEFVKALKDRRIDAVMSYTIMPDPVVSDKDALAAKAKEIGVDTVLINRPIGTTTRETAGFTNYEDLYINTQIDVYDIKSNRLIFRATAETWIRQDIPYSIHIKSYVKDVVQKLSRQELL